MATSAPHWLGPVGKKWFTRTLKANPGIRDRDSLAMMADAYETYRSAHDEVQGYVKESRSFILNGKPHDALGIATRAHQQYERIGRRLGLWQATKAEEELDLELDETDEPEADEASE